MPRGLRDGGYEAEVVCVYSVIRAEDVLRCGNSSFVPGVLCPMAGELENREGPLLLLPRICLST